MQRAWKVFITFSLLFLYSQLHNAFSKRRDVLHKISPNWIVFKWNLKLESCSLSNHPCCSFCWGSSQVPKGAGLSLAAHDAWTLCSSQPGQGAPGRVWLGPSRSLSAQTRCQSQKVAQHRRGYRPVAHPGHANPALWHSQRCFIQVCTSWFSTAAPQGASCVWDSWGLAAQAHTLLSAGASLSVSATGVSCWTRAATGHKATANAWCCAKVGIWPCFVSPTFI